MSHHIDTDVDIANTDLLISGDTETVPRQKQTTSSCGCKWHTGGYQQQGNYPNATPMTYGHACAWPLAVQDPCLDCAGESLNLYAEPMVPRLVLHGFYRPNRPQTGGFRFNDS